MNKKKKENKPSKALWEEILDNGDIGDVRGLFAFDSTDSEEEILWKFRLWSRWFYPKFFKSNDAPFHEQIDLGNIAVYTRRPITKGGFLQKVFGKLLSYLGIIKYFVDIAFRGAAKTTRTKLFVAFCIANDADHSRKYIKVLSGDIANSKQIVTDVYNMLILKRVQYYYPEIFAKSELKRQETMGVWSTASGIKVQADTVGVEQRGDLQGEEESARPDFLWFDDYETRKTLRSAVITQTIWDNMQEALDGMDKKGGAIFNCNYLSERGNVHKLVEKYKSIIGGLVLISPIKGTVENNLHIDGLPTWPEAYTPEEVETILANADDPAGEYLCTPSAGADVFFDRTTLDRQEKKSPVEEIAGLKIFHKFNPSHRYGVGADTAGGVGLDSSTSTIIDFSTIPAKVVATFANNTIKPDVFGHELIRQANIFGQPIIAPENNKYDMVIGTLRHENYPNIYFTEQKETRVGMPPRTRTYGWNTNGATKSKMLFELKKAVEDGHLELSDPALIAELRSYTRDDLMDRDEDVRLTTRHFDILISCAIAYQMRNWAESTKEVDIYQQPEYERTGLES